MTERDKEADVLEALFSAGRSIEKPGDEFLSQLMADASEAAARNVPTLATPREENKPKFWQTWLPVSGLTAATLAGIWIGTVLPHSDLGSEYLAEFSASDVASDGFSPTFGVSAFVEDEE